MDLSLILLFLGLIACLIAIVAYIRKANEAIEKRRAAYQTPYKVRVLPYPLSFLQRHLGEQEEEGKKGDLVDCRLGFLQTALWGCMHNVLSQNRRLYVTARELYNAKFSISGNPKCSCFRICSVIVLVCLVATGREWIP